MIQPQAIKDTLEKDIEKAEEIIDPKTKIPFVSRPTYRRRNIVFWTALSLCIIAFILLTILAKKNPYFPFDLLITRAIQQIQSPLFLAIMNFITLLGINIYVAILLVLGTVFFLRKGLIKEGFFLACSTLGAEALADIFKIIVARPRPSHELIKQVGQFTIHDSFPSGHVMFYIGFFGFLLFLTFTLMKKRLKRNILLSLFLLLIILIGPSRIYLGAHWFSDVIGAYLLGSLWLAGIIYLYNHWDPPLPFFKQ